MAKSDASPTGLEYLLAPTAPQGSVVAVVGDDGFLKHEVLASLRRSLCGEGEGDIDWHSFEGPVAEWRDVIDAVGQLSLFGGGGKPVAVIDDADPFVTRYREKLEDFAAGKAAGVLVLDVKTLPGNTRLAKAIAESGLLVSCKTPERGPEVGKHRRDAAKWLTMRAESVHQTKLTADAIDVLFDLLPMSLGVIDQEVARLALLTGDSKRIDGALARDNVGGWRTRTAWDLVDAAADGRAADAIDVLFDLLPMSLGVIDQEVARLALLAGDGGKIDGALARDNVGGWRTRTAWDLVDAAADGRAADALGQLSRLLLAGEQPIGVLAQLGSTLRKFSAAAANVEAAERMGQRPSLSAALKAAGFAPFKIEDAERQLRQIGRGRASQLADWVLEADLAMKSHNSAPARARLELERLLLRLSREAAAVR